MFFLFVSLASTLLISDASAYTCRVNGTLVPYDIKERLCCNNDIPLRRIGNKIQRCCNGTTLYFHEEYICCGDHLYHKRYGTEKCCGVYPYVPSRFTLCCGNSQQNAQVYKNVGSHEKCCKTAKIDKTKWRCCENQAGSVKRYHVDNSKDCCGLQYYNTSTHECHKHREVVLPKFYRFCGNLTYDERLYTCCQGVLHSGKTGCCGSEAMDEKLKKCCRNMFQIDKNMACCGNYTAGYNILTELCCGSYRQEIIIKKQTGDHECCGTDTYNIKKEACCNNDGIGTIRDIESYKRCDNETHCSFVEVDGKCCGAEKLHENYVCCEAGRFTQKLVFSKEKTRPNHDQCCTSTLPTSNGSQSYSKDTDICHRNATPSVSPKLPNKAPICVREEGLWKLYQEEIQEGKIGCCGREPYNREQQSCCGNKVVNRRRCHRRNRKNRDSENEIQDEIYARKPCPVICSNDEKRIMRKIRKSHLPFCKLYAYKVTVSNIKKLTDSTMFRIRHQGKVFLKNGQGTRQLKSRIQKIYLPCKCPKFNKNLVVLTNKPLEQRSLTVDDNDLIIPYTSRIRRKLKRVWRRKCHVSEILVTEELVDDIFNLIKMKIKKQNAKNFF